MAFADTGPAPKWKEVDGSPSGRPRTIVVSNDTISFSGNTMSLDMVTTASADATFVPYQGAHQDVDLGVHRITADGVWCVNNVTADSITCDSIYVPDGTMFLYDTANVFTLYRNDVEYIRLE